MTVTETQLYAFRARHGDTDEICAAVEQLFAKLPAAQRLGPHSRVLVKPNLLSKFSPDKAVTTHPDVLLGVVLALQRRGVADILVADSPGGRYTPATMRDVYRTTGVQAVCDKTGVQTYTACESCEVESGGSLVPRFRLIAPIRERDFIVNVPKIKTHTLMGLTCAVKNNFGLVPGLEKAEFHTRFPEKERFGQMLVDLCETVKADIHIVDGVLSMEGNGPSGGSPRYTGLVMGGENPYLLDWFVCRYIGMEPQQPAYLATAMANGLCPEAPGENCLEADSELATGFRAFRLPDSYASSAKYPMRLPVWLRPVADFAARFTAPRPKIAKEKCVGCGKCAEICPRRVITIEGAPAKARIQPKDCIKCFCCHEMCPVKAIDIQKFFIYRM